ncbi:uncharacterized protein TNCV_762911 [Trichonephila clavipes]|nr:uncharacterized protein TNCV_762911 [Trichonephila clavipes]
MSWRTAVVIPILKPGKNSALAESYRPISLLPVLSKLAEKLILARLNDHLERENILIPEQHGFRPRLSTSHQLLRVVEFIKEGNNKDECTAAVFLDIQKAFDRYSPSKEQDAIENLSVDQSIEMEETIPQTVTDQQKCNNLQSIARQIDIFSIRKAYVTQLLDYEKSSPGPTPETTLNLEEEAAGLNEKIKALEGNMSELLPCPVSLCAHNFKYKNNKKRAAEPIIRPAKLTIKNNDKSNKLDDEEFKIPRKTSKGINVPKEDSKIIATKNKFAALNSANKDVEDVTPAAPRIKPIMMKLFLEYNLFLQEIHRTHPTATNTHVGGWIKIQAENLDHHREITLFLSDKKCQYYVTDPSANRPLKVVIKGLLATTDSEEIKKDLIEQGINIVKIAQLRQFKTKSPLPIFMIEIARDENVDDIFKIKNCLYMQIKIDPFKKKPQTYAVLQLQLFSSCKPEL